LQMFCIPYFPVILMAATENEGKRIQFIFSHNPGTGGHGVKFPDAKFKTTLHNKLSNSLTH